jgi:hypothetical protein
MKIKGKDIEKPAEQVVVFPRQNEDIIFKAKPVTNYEDFDKLCPTPQPESIMKPGGVISEDIESPKYKKAMDDWATKKMHWMVLKSLEATDDLEWDTVDMSDPETYENYMKELEEAGITGVEANKLMEIIQDACGLNQDKIDEATRTFLATQVAQ